jgi:hypothetical protein
MAAGCVLAPRLIWIKPDRLERVGNAGVMKLSGLWFILSLVWLAVLAGGMLLLIFA